MSETPSGEAAERSQNSCEYPGREPDPAGLGPRLPGKLRFVKQAFGPRAKATGMTWEQWQVLLASRTQPRRLMTLAEMPNVAVFIAPACHVSSPRPTQIIRLCTRRARYRLVPVTAQNGSARVNGSWADHRK
jgi:hypothetical protein